MHPIINKYRGIYMDILTIGTFTRVTVDNLAMGFFVGHNVGLLGRIDPFGPWVL